MDAVVTGVMRRGAPEFRGSGAWPDGNPASGDSVLYAASVTKQFIAALLAQAVERGELREGDALRSWIPELPSWADRIRLEQLVHHTSGLPRDVELDGERTTDAVIRALSLALAPTPGDRYEYSNEGYVLLGRVLERSAGIPLESLATARILEPLGLRGSVLSRRPLVEVPGEPRPPSTLGDGGLWTTPRDLLIWLDALNSGRLGPGVTSRVARTGRLATGIPVEYAWGARRSPVDGHLVYSHGGTWERWQTTTRRIPDAGVAIVVAARASQTDDVISCADALTQEALSQASA